MTATYLAKDRFNHAIQALMPGTVQNVTTATGASAATTNNIGGDTVVVRLFATTDAYVSMGPSATVAASNASLYLPAGIPEYFRIEQAGGLTAPGWKIAALAVTGAGTLNVTEMV